MSDGHGIRYTCRNYTVPGTKDNTAVCPGKLALIAQYEGVICILYFIFRTNDRYVIDISSDILETSNRVIGTWPTAGTGHGVVNANHSRA